MLSEASPALGVSGLRELEPWQALLPRSGMQADAKLQRFIASIDPCDYFYIAPQTAFKAAIAAMPAVSVRNTRGPMDSISAPLAIA